MITKILKILLSIIILFLLRNNSYAVELEDRVIIDRNDQIVNELKSDKKNANYSNESLKGGTGVSSLNFRYIFTY